MKITGNDYQIFQQFLSQSCGIVLGESKQYLVINRLSCLLEKFDLISFSELAGFLQASCPVSLKIKVAVIDAMTTNETFWFRDDMQFQALREEIFPEIIKQKAGTVKIWSAACSSGQEPYSISMCAEDSDVMKEKNRNVQIIATDISESILKEARAAEYSEMVLSRGLDSQTRKRFFQKTHHGSRLNNEITQKVRFQQFNLLKPFSVLGRFDVIFCRNVLIYFSDQVKQDILIRMAASLETGGCLFLSSTESMPACIKEFEPVRSGRVRYFRKVS